MLQTRNGKRTAAAAIKIACDLIDEKMITEQEALMQIDAKSLDMLLHPQFDPEALKEAEERIVAKAAAGKKTEAETPQPQPAKPKQTQPANFSLNFLLDSASFI